MIDSRRFSVASIGMGILMFVCSAGAGVVISGGTMERDTTATSDVQNTSTSNTSPASTVNYSNSDMETATSNNGTTVADGNVSNSVQVSSFLFMGVTPTTQIQLLQQIAGDVGGPSIGGSGGGTASVTGYTFTLDTPMDVLVDVSLSSATQNADRANSDTASTSFVLRKSDSTILINSATDGNTLVVDQVLPAGTYLFDDSASGLVTSPTIIGSPNVPPSTGASVDGFINFTAVPEPTMLSGLSLALCCLLRRRR